MHLFSAEPRHVTVEQLTKELEAIQDWPVLGFLLGVRVESIEEIKRATSEISECKRKLFHYWRAENPRALWADVITAVEKLGNIELAAKLRRKHMWNDHSESLYYF